MKAVESGNIKVKGLSKKEAKEFTKGNKGKYAFSTLKERLGNKVQYVCKNQIHRNRT